MSGPLLVVGFGAFLDVVDNPAATLARALDGAVVDGPAGPVVVVGRVIPVTWRGCVADTVRHAEQVGAAVVLGVGVARTRSRLNVERAATRRVGLGVADAAGVCLEDLDPTGPEVRHATIPTAAFAAALGADLSDDAGAYVCNAWLYQSLAVFGVPVGFLHLPRLGVDAERVRRALPWLWERRSC